MQISLEEAKRCAGYRMTWKKLGYVQTSMWLPENQVNELKARAVAEGKKYSTVVSEIIAKALNPLI